VKISPIDYMNAVIPASTGAQPQSEVRVFWLGLFLQLSVLIGVVGTCLGMVKAFHTLGEPVSESLQVLSWKDSSLLKFSASRDSAAGASAIGNPDKLSAAIGQVLESTVIGWAGNNLGVLLCLFALWHYRLRRQWMFWTSMLLGLFVMPFGLFLLVYCLVYRHEFFPRPIKVELR
jgi:hypothetical protein